MEGVHKGTLSVAKHQEGLSAHSPAHQDISNVVQISIDQLFKQLKPRQPSIAQLVNTSAHASLGRLSAGIDNLKINKNVFKNRSQAHHCSAPASKPPTPKT